MKNDPARLYPGEMTPIFPAWIGVASLIFERFFHDDGLFAFGMLLTIMVAIMVTRNAAASPD